MHHDKLQRGLRVEPIARFTIMQMIAPILLLLVCVMTASAQTTVLLHLYNATGKLLSAIRPYILWMAMGPGSDVTLSLTPLR